MPVVEIGTWLVTDRYLEDQTILREPFDIVRKADGCLEVYYGLTEEDPKKIYLLIVWESLEHHTAFTRLPIFHEAIKVVVTTQAKDVNVFHVEFNKDITPSLLAPTTQVVLANLKDNVSREYLYSVFAEIAAQIDQANTKHAPVTWGQIKEDSSRFFLMVGWDSSKVSFI
ncbi:hypothetical protein CVT25_000952 [Psilocybe cyanescens]|uniref:ABM domain-containing protein n=1 Tax=Psilocybe cyanescens TaxID=93625 RepID=A0A409XSB1_PSICY|nr:hypothetical protein CVT25_000952 [Psilocybe cyanescens]